MKKTITFNIPEQVLDTLEMPIDTLIQEIAMKLGCVDQNPEEHIKKHIISRIFMPAIQEIINEKAEKQKTEKQHKIISAI